MRKWWFLWVLAGCMSMVCGQEIDVANALEIIPPQGDNTYACWSPDGTKIAFQTNRNGNWDIYIYDLTTKTEKALVSGLSQEQHPTWFPDGRSVVFDSDSLGYEYLFRCRLSDGKITPLFKRDIICQQASFPQVPRQVYFSGYDKVSKQWQIYSYDFVYDNLNRLTQHKAKCADPQVAPDGKHLIYLKARTVFEPSSFPIINWYGEELGRLDSLRAKDPCWNESGLKVYFVSYKDDVSGELYSIWENGSHLERLTFDTLQISQPAISPNGKSFLLTVGNTSGAGIRLIELPEY